MAGEAVAWFEIQVAGRAAHATHSSIEICGNEQFHLGRDAELCRYSWSDDLTISRLHLRVHCILYEQDPIAHIAPFVYATDLSANGTHLKKSNSECSASQDHGILMGPNCTFLLDDNDKLYLSDKVTLIYHSMRHVEDADLTVIQQRERNAFASRYLITGRLLGEGGYGKVLVSVHQRTQRQLACKIIRLDHMYQKLAVPNLQLPSEAQSSCAKGKKNWWPTRVARCFREFDILKDLSHPNIISLEKVFWSHNTIYIFLELVTGGDLFSFLEYKGGRLDNVQAAVIVQQILKGVEYLHNQDIVHRDLKPDNILMTSLEDGARAVITDFGNARFLPGKNNASAVEPNKYQRMFSCVGTLEFAAPEIHKANRAIPVEDGYSKSVDMWSIGSVTATILTGDVIFTDRKHPGYYDNPRAVIVSLSAICDLSVLDESYHPLWSVVGDRPKSFIRGLLVLEEDERMTASEALAHPWFANECHAEDYEKLYERSIRDWEPHIKDFQLIENISKTVPTLTVGRRTTSSESQETASRFFTRQISGPTHNMLQKLSASQRWRANTPLPSIREEYGNAQFTNQTQRMSCEGEIIGSSLQDYGQLHSNRQSSRRSGGADNQDTSNAPLNNAPISYDTDALQKRKDSFRAFPRSSSLRDVAASVVDHGSVFNKDGDCNRSGTSLKAAKKFSQRHGGFQHAQRLEDFGEAQEMALIEETPLAAELELRTCSGYGQQANESYQQICHLDEHHQNHAREEEQDSILVFETPPDDL
ncbi:kinase-like domain-containing protein [Pyrenochaeta sp. MPI-SDFR-AT-0127]|nr:kinase-like domain-containing protein [Pyrenochaeta sp. MPI-SDFR-AT-0127]